MDEEALLGEAAGPIGDRLISKEEEEALLNDDPTTSDSATTVIAAALEPIPADPGHVLPEAAEADEDESMQHTDTESNEASDETRELLENNDLPTSSSNSDSSSQSPAPCSIQNNNYIKSVILASKERLSKSEVRRHEQTRRKMNRMMELSEDQRSALRKIVNMSVLQTSIEQKLKDLATNYENLTTQQVVRNAGPAVFAVPSVPLQRTPPAQPENSSNNNSRKRRAQPVQTAPSARRTSTGPPPPPMQKRRSSNGAIKGTPSPAAQQVQPQQQRAVSARVQRTDSQHTPPAQRAVTARVQQQLQKQPAPAPEPLPRPGQYQQAQSFGGALKTSPIGLRQHSNGQRLQQVAQQHQPMPVRSPRNSLNGVPAAAAAGPSTSSNGMTQAQRAAAESIAVQQQQNRKRSHPQSQQQLVQQAVAIGSNGNAAAMTAADKIHWCLLASATLKDSQQISKAVAQVLSQTRHMERIEQELAANAADQRPTLTIAERRIDQGFVVPSPTDKRKLEISVDKQVLLDPITRPNELLPYESEWMRNDRFAPQIELQGDHEDFIASGKVSGKIRFTPPSAWPENNARICLFYYIGTKNSQEWMRSEFATAELKKEGDQFNEVTVRFIYTLGPEYFHVQHVGGQQRAAVLHPTIWKEMIGMVAFACAGDAAASTEYKIRGDEKVYEFGVQKAQAERKKMTRYVDNFAGFYQRNAAEVARRTTPEVLRTVHHHQQQHLQQQRMLQQQRAQAAAADDDDDIAIIN